jgi:hypothetical protein
MTAGTTFEQHLDRVPDQLALSVLGRWAARCYDHRRTVLVVWILLIIGVTAISQVIGTRFQNDFTAGNTPSQQAANILASRFRPDRVTRPMSSFMPPPPSPPLRTAPPSPGSCGALIPCLMSSR